jgi:hypothetical protein
MSRSQQRHQKREKEKQRIQHRQEKAEKMQERKANAQKGKNLDDMLAFLDENGNLTTTPPDAIKHTPRQQDGQDGAQKQVDTGSKH